MKRRKHPRYRPPTKQTYWERAIAHAAYLKEIAYQLQNGTLDIHDKKAVAAAAEVIKRRGY